MSIQLTESETKDLELKLGQIRLEHRDLKKVIEIMIAHDDFDHLQICRLKKRKLLLKDQIMCIENMLIPDLDA